MIKLIEPLWWINLLGDLNSWMVNNSQLVYRIPKFADLFILTYPIYLLVLYIYGIVKREIYYKKSALFIFISTVLSFAGNIFIQLFVDKVRPNVILGLVDRKNETILHRFMPSSSFPSDHAAVSMWIAVASVVRWMKNNDKKFIRFGVILIIFSLLTWFARITAAVHWPTDIIAGSVIWILIPILIWNKKIYRYFDKYFTMIARLI